MKKHSFLCAVMAIALLFVLFSCEGEIAVPVYTVTLDYDNGTDIVETQVTAGLKFNIPEVVPVKENYEFDHWLCNGVEYKPGDEIVINSNMKIKAVWRERAALKDDEALVTFVLNDKVMAEKLVEKGKTVLAPTEGYTISDDYIFDGWYLDGAKFDFTQPVNGNITLTAKWGRKIWVMLSVTRGSRSEFLASYQVMEGSTLSDIEGYTTPESEGREFLYWSTADSISRYEDDTPLKGDKSSKLELYTRWDRDYSYVTFDPANNENTTKSRVDYGSAVSVPFDPVSEGRFFLGWYEEGSSNSFDFDIPIKGDVKLTAKWGSSENLPDDMAVITYDMGESSQADRTITLKKGRKYSILSYIPDSDGSLSFEYWNDSTGKTITEESSEVTVDSNMSFIAIWKNRVITLYFCDIEQNIERTVNYGEILTDIPTATAKDCTCCKFLYWIDGEDNAHSEFDFSKPITPSDGRDYIKLSATYSVGTYTLTMDPANGEDKISCSITCGWTAQRPNDPVWANHTFAGWYTEDGAEFDFFSTPIKKDTAIIAHWVDGEASAVEGKSTIRFVYGVEGLSDDTVMVTTGSEYDVYNFSHKNRDGYNLSYWLDEDNERVYRITVDKDMVLTACWTEKIITVYFLLDKDDSRGDSYDKQSIKYGDKVTEPEKPIGKKVPTGYEFDGWISGETYLPFDFDAPVISDSCDIIASWKLLEYMVTVDYGYDSLTDSVSVKYGETFSLKTPERACYKFAGWKNAEGGDFDFSAGVIGPVTVTASWTPTTTYEVHFRSVNGTEIGEPVSVSSDTSWKVSTRTPDDIAGTTFRAWYKGDAEFDPFIFGGEPYDFDSEVSSDMYLYAFYTIDSIEGTWAASGGVTLTMEEDKTSGTTTISSSLSSVNPVGSWTYNAETGAFGLHMDNPFGVYLTGNNGWYRVDYLGKGTECLFANTVFTYSPLYYRRTEHTDSVVGTWLRQEGRWNDTVILTEDKGKEELLLYRNSTRSGTPVATVSFEGGYTKNDDSFNERIEYIIDGTVSTLLDYNAVFSYAVDATHWGVIGILIDSMVLVKQ